MRFVNRNNVCKGASTLFLWHNRRKEKALQKESAVMGISPSAEGDQGSAFGNRKPLKRLEPNFKADAGLSSPHLFDDISSG